MNQVITDLWPYLIPALLAVVGWQWKEAHSLRLKVVVLEKTIEDIQKEIDSMKKRQDSHSKKQDEIVTLITDLKLEMVKQIGGLTTEVKSINRVLSITDDGVNGIKFKKES